MSTISALAEIQEQLVCFVEHLDEEKVLSLAQEALDSGIEPPLLVELVNEGMKRVGKLYEKREYYIADLIMSGIIFKQVMELDKMQSHFQSSNTRVAGKVLLGTVKGDIHDIGKDIFRGMLETNGFKVIDLGVDVPKEVFLQKAMEYRPDVVGLSGVLTDTVEAMKDVVNFFLDNDFRDEVRFIIGGDHLNAAVCEYVGADSFANDAAVGVRKCKELLKRHRN